jgi:hypothetical protein
MLRDDMLPFRLKRDAGRPRASNRYMVERWPLLCRTILFGLIIVASGCGKSGPSLTISKAAPNSSFLVELWDEPRGFNIDRHFKVILRDRRTNAETVLFKSPDEGAPGTERFAWSRDSRYFVLIGKNFGIETNAPLTRYNSSYKADEYAYLLYDTSEKRLFCNANQDETFPRFWINDLATKNFDPAEVPILSH